MEDGMNPNSEDTLRLATVKATGDRYIVTRIDFTDGVVYCFGEVVGAQGAQVKEWGTDAGHLMLADVTISKRRRTPKLITALWKQGCTNIAKARGCTVAYIPDGRGGFRARMVGRDGEFRVDPVVKAIEKMLRKTARDIQTS
jgi:hypothetical protein